MLVDIVFVGQNWATLLSLFLTEYKYFTMDAIGHGGSLVYHLYNVIKVRNLSINLTTFTS
ncbi:hypothetical protein SAMN05216524_11310 [Mucilaginibacter sp. OK098]|nr:hypothetical protein SAMN05216524_11310 [Mucilaginibacter sp. OK098]